MEGTQSPNTVRLRTFPTAQCLKTLLFRGRKGRRGGQTTVEFALICLPFFAILFALIDYAQIYFYENALQNAMRETARFTTAGRVIQAYNSDGSLAYETNAGNVMAKAINDSSGREASRYACSRYWFNSNCVIQLPSTDIVITSAPAISGVPPTVSTNSAGKLTLLLTNGGTANAGPGAANDYVQITVSYTIPTITPLFGYLNGGYSRVGMNKYPVIFSAIVKNEPAGLNFLHTNMYSGE